jgi:hypothetical protein
MFSGDEPRFDLIDDPLAPEPDAAVFERVVARGRQRQNRRRALFGGVGVALVAALLTGGVAAAQHHNAGPKVNVQSPGEFFAPDTTSTTVAPSEATPTTIRFSQGSPDGAVPTTAPRFPLPPGTQDAQAGDFSGAVTVDPAVVTAGDDVGVQLMIRNITDHVVNVEGSVSVAVVCANDLTTNGQTSTPLHFENPDANIFWVIAPPMNPGEESGIGPMTVQTTAAEVGTVTCEGVLVRSNSDSGTFTSTIVARLDNTPAVSYTVLAASTDTSTTTTPDGSTTTTAPQ